MLLWLSEYLIQFHSGFNVFQYITLRTILGALTSLLIALIVGPVLIRYLSRYQVGQAVRDDGPVSHLAKTGTPTMGGLLIIISIAFSTLCWANLSNRFIWTVITVTLAFAVIGYIDDYRKVVRQDPKGLPARWKYFWQSVFALSAAVFLFHTAGADTETRLILPFVKTVSFDLGWAFIVLTYFVIVGSSNAVNLTDGLDGLAVLPTVMVAGALAIFAYAAGNIRFAQYLGIPYVPGVGEVCVFCGAIVGSGLGFLWFNTYPAQIFMGDIGSLSLGGALAMVAVITKQEILLAIVGGIFVIEALSVIIQVSVYQTKRKRVFKMAPIHHHYELKGWAEPKIIVRFWIITIILSLFAISTLKLR